MSDFLPHAYYEKYDRLLQLLLAGKNTSLDVLSSPDNQTQELEDFYHQEIFPLTGEEIPLEARSRWRSIQTEIHRSMKLLALDISLLKAARSPQRQQTRSQGVSDRLSTLISYCQVILTLDPSPHQS